ncbi:MAG: hypothetical protein LBU64_13130 [Planctomycetota bacterium]|jgi:hypothetical protein|nr:hypothetical protein [Planctomycetota bacterium]
MSVPGEAPDPRDEFNAFTVAKVRPALDDTLARGKRRLALSLAAGAAAFLFSLGLLGILVGPHREALEKNVPYSTWILLVFPSLSLAVVFGVLGNLLLLARNVERLRLTILESLAGFLGPGMELEAPPATPWRGKPGERLPAGLEKARLGKAVFRGRRGKADLRLASLWLPPERGRDGKADLPGRDGAFVQIELAAPPAGLESGPELAARPTYGQAGRNIEVSGRREGNLVNLALLWPDGTGTDPLAEFNLDRYREFCLAARLGLAIAEELGKTS